MNNFAAITLCTNLHTEDSDRASIQLSLLDGGAA